jgi:drug/metabolite transporter (DMT)-like permease
VDVLPATQIRVAGAALVMVAMAALTGRLGTWISGFHRHRLVAPMTLASFFGPFCGILLLSVALDHTSTGVALTLSATIPIWLLPLGAWFQDDRPTLREGAGAVIAVAGVAILLIGGASS